MRCWSWTLVRMFLIVASVPELTRRGRYKAEYAPGTLREKLFGVGRARLNEQHPAARYRPGVRSKAAE